jgi:hypothetical protein
LSCPALVQITQLILIQVKFVLLNSYSQEEDKTGVLSRLVQLGSELVSLLTLLDSGTTEHLNREIF